MKQENDEKKELYDLLDFTDAKKHMILNNLINSQTLFEPINISNDVYKDTTVDKWCESLPSLEGSKILINNLIRCPINDTNILQKRQKCYFKENIDFEILKQYENDVLWIYKLNDEIKENNLIHVLFPSTFIISYMNYIEPILESYHIYKIYLIPLSIIIYPILSLFAPLYYLNKYLGFSISFTTYVSILLKIVKYMFTYSGNIKTTLLKIISICTYIFLFAYNIYQTTEYSYMLYDVKNTLYKRICNLNIFIKEAAKIIETLPPDITKAFVKLNRNIHNDIQSIDLTNKFSNIYRIWKENSLKEKLSNILVNIYIIDIINSISKQIYRNKDWCVVSYDNSCTKFWNMKNPILNKEQTANPVSLSKNIVITGPNAAGKTTYVKSILSNIILSQTFGIAYAVKGNVIVYDTIASFMRISDILGSKSYFEVEAEYCLKMMQNAQDLSKHNKKGLFLMDEPMHSTPPTEGMATAYAVAEYIGKLQGITIILTTHFHKLIQLENKYADKFINLSVEAIPKKSGGFEFPYKIKKGYSYQCIAIELLSSKDFPKSVIDSAINMKNKICAEISR
jgi:hypothetical protein